MWLCFVLKEDETREVKKILSCYGKALRCDLRVVLLEIDGCRHLYNKQKSALQSQLLGSLSQENSEFKARWMT